MKWIKEPDKNSIIPVYAQIKDNFLNAIKSKDFKVGDSIPSIHKLCAEFKLAPGTIIRAYEELRELGVLSSKQGKGYFIKSTDLQQRTRVFLLFDRITNFKEILYDAFIDHLSDDVEVNVFFHHYDIKRFEKLIRENIGKYSHYIIMPHFNSDVSKIISKIPEKKLILIDNRTKNIKRNINAVYQDFKNDIYSVLESEVESIKKYNKIWLSLSKSKFQFVPDGCIVGFKGFCSNYGIKSTITSNIHSDSLKKNEVYIIFSDVELINTIKEINKKGWILGKDIGVISFDDTPIKEVLCNGISVMSTDFKQMGMTAAKIVKGEAKGQIRNPFQLIRRSSF